VKIELSPEELAMIDKALRQYDAYLKAVDRVQVGYLQLADRLREQQKATGDAGARKPAGSAADPARRKRRTG